MLIMVTSLNVLRTIAVEMNTKLLTFDPHLFKPLDIYSKEIYQMTLLNSFFYFLYNNR